MKEETNCFNEHHEILLTIAKLRLYSLTDHSGRLMGFIAYLSSLKPHSVGGQTAA